MAGRDCDCMSRDVLECICWCHHASSHQWDAVGVGGRDADEEGCGSHSHSHTSQSQSQAHRSYISRFCGISDHLMSVSAAAQNQIGFGKLTMVWAQEFSKGKNIRICL